ncbi:MAG: hypothetical protein Q7S50_00930 [bacterium]|nr:hypothetical protein [bacterium]
MYQVIRVSDKQDSEWHRLGKFGKEWNAGYPLATLATVLAFGITFGIGLGLLPEARLDQYQHMLLGIVLASMAVAGIVILGTVLPMNRYNRKVRANRKRLQAAFLAQFGAMTPDEVATPYSWGGGIKYALVPDGVNNELQYQTY